MSKVYHRNNTGNELEKKFLEMDKYMKNQPLPKERKEFEALTVEIDELTAEKSALEARFNSGETLTDVAAMSARYDEISRILDDKEMRWLELSELS